MHFNIFIFNYLFILGAALHSGLYVDNGHDQTVIHRSLSNRERQHFEVELLDLLGLPERPRVSRSTPVRSSGHKYLLDLYKSQLDAPARPTRSRFTLSDSDLSVIGESDAILSLKNLYHVEPNSTSDEKGQKLWFDVKTISRSVDGIISAQLRVFHSSLISSAEDKMYTLAVYVIKDEDRNCGKKNLEFVSAVNISSGFEGWHQFNMTGPLTQWMLSGDNYGVYLKAYETNSPDIDVDLNDLGIAKVASHLDGEEEPFMIVFMQGETRRSTRVRRQTRHRKKKTENSETPNINPLTDLTAGHSWSQSPRSCQIQSLFVNFSDLKWQDWIIAPVGYSAFYCSGECNFPLNAHMNATNHAIVQTLVNLINPLRVPRPCCAPTKLTPISVLYFVDDNNVILKKYKNMVVKSCGCH